MPAPSAAPTLTSLAYNSTVTPVAFTKLSTKTSLKNRLAQAFVDATNTPVELYNCDGSAGAAVGAGIGAGVYSSAKAAFSHTKPLQLIEPSSAKAYDGFYHEWKEVLLKQL